MTFIKRYALWIASVFTICLTFLYFSTNQLVKKELSLTEKIIALSSEPVEFVFYYTSHTIISLYNSYQDLIEKKTTVAFLKKENVELKTQLNFFKNVESENEELRKLLGFKEKSALKLEGCEILHADPTFTYKSLRIDRGSSNGVEYGMGVISTEGVVGVVTRTSPHFSDVLLLTDPNSSIDVIIARNRRRGLLQGGLNHLMQFKYLEGGGDLFIGDQLMTSGLTGSFPAGIPVGTVTNIKWSSDNSTQIVDVEPVTHFSFLMHALVILTPNRDLGKNNDAQ